MSGNPSEAIDCCITTSCLTEITSVISLMLDHSYVNVLLHGATERSGHLGDAKLISTMRRPPSVAPVKRRRDGSKRAEILAIAAAQFGQEGFDATKWADIATAAGVGGPALYYYFESKNHCLFTLLAESLVGWAEAYQRLLDPEKDPVDALTEVAHATFDVSDRDAHKNRLLVAEQGKLSTIRTTGREEEARAQALATTRAIEQTWVDFLLAAMKRGAIPVADARLLARASIGLLQSVWRWYRPSGAYRLEDLADFYATAVLRLVGAAPLAGTLAVTPPMAERR